jgi:hypothetical protein
VLIKTALRLFSGKDSTTANHSGFETSAIWGDGPEQQIKRFTRTLLSDFSHWLQECIVVSIISDPGKVEKPFLVTKTVLTGVSAIAASAP